MPYTDEQLGEIFDRSGGDCQSDTEGSLGACRGQGTLGFSAGF